jgi:hypothetical protein
MSEGHDVDACARKRMSRRFFFGVMGGAAVAVAVAPTIEQQLREHFILPAVRHDELLTIQMITAEILEVLRGNLKTVSGIKLNMDRIFANEKARIGDTLTIRKPRDFVGQERTLWPA